MLKNAHKILTFIIFHFILISLIKSEENIYQKFKCNIDSIKETPELVNKTLQIKNPKSRRNLANKFKDLSIFLDLNNLEEEIKLYNLTEQREFFITGLKKAVHTLEKLIKIKQPQNYVFTDEMLLKNSINYWDKTKIGDDATEGMVSLNIDLFIFIRFGNNTDMGSSTLASASAKYLDQDSGQPLLGLINLNRNVDYTKVNSLRYFELILLHEMTHVLGFTQYFFKTFFHNFLEKEDNYGIKRAYINSAKVVEVAKKYFNCSTVEGVELEDYGGSGTVGSHWESRILLGEYMNGVTYSEEEVISEFTLALLEDTGFYQVKYYTGGLMQFGKNKGCEFLNSKCVENGSVNPKFKNEFFDTIYGNYFDPSCSSGRQSRTYHMLNRFTSIPVQYQYFTNERNGGRASSDYCPVSQENIEETQKSYYVGHCSQLGSGDYGIRINYKNSTTLVLKRYKSSELSSINSEKHSDNSFCVLSSLISKKIDNYKYYSSTVRAVCYQMHCSDRSLTIQINTDYIVCPRAGGKIEAVSFSGYLLCPDYNLICSGTVLCNDFLDCIEKNSTLKDDIIYDYESRTSQDLEDEDLAEFSKDAYELSSNGKCPLYCSQCNAVGQCIKCRNDYSVVEYEENKEIKWGCKLTSELNVGYYKKNEIYYKCPDNCYKCVNSSSCEKCKLDYIFISTNNKCLKNVENCENYNDDGRCIKCQINYKLVQNENICVKEIPYCLEEDENHYCIRCEENYRLAKITACYKIIEKCEKYGDGDFCDKCEDGYAFEENNKTICKDINLLDEHFSIDNGINYYKCDNINEGGMESCSKCEYNDNNSSQVLCLQCKNNFVLINEDHSICYDNETFKENRKYYYIDSFNLKSCSKSIDKCDECIKNDKNEDEDGGEDIICTLCEENYFFVNENYTNCVKKEEILPIDEYYFNEEKKEYFSCGNINYHQVKNCKKCNNNFSCTLCDEEYTLIDENRSMCVNISELGNNYIIDKNDSSIYRKCNYYIENCDACTSYNKCISCLDDFGLNNDQDKCINVSDNHYYKNSTDNLYYLCNYALDNCEKCRNENECISCMPNYVEINNLCYDKIENCKEYNDNGNCVKCQAGYNITEEENRCEIIYKNCIKVDDDGICIECKDNYKLQKSLCYRIIEKCQIYKDDEFCEKCEDGYAFEENNKTICKVINLLKEHFSKDNGINYYKCDNINEGGVESCSKCEYNNDNSTQVLCLQCKNNFVLIDDDKSICYNNETFKENRKYYYIDSFNLKSCSKSIDKCDECIVEVGDIICEKCIDDYYIVNKEDIACNKIDEIKPLDEYYYNENKKAYYFCGNKNYHSIDNCQKCNSSTSCNLCKDGYTFIDDDKSFCQNISKLGEKYIKDENDSTIYRKCDYYMHNCDTCSSIDTCLTCQTNYNLFFNKRKCINISDNHYYINYTDKKTYYCHQSINKCEMCTNAHTCRRCMKDYYLVGTSLNECFLLSEFDVSRYYINSSNDNQYLKCSNAITNCLSCESQEKCNLCESGYIFLDNNFKKCYNKSEINLTKYYTEDNITYNSCENKKFRSNIQCFSIIKNQNIILSFIQVQLFKNHLYFYMLTDSPFPKNFSLKTKIVVYNNIKRLRHLDQVEKEIVLRAMDDSNGNGKTIIRFISDEEFDANESIQVKEIVPNNDKITNSVTEDNTFSIADFSSDLKQSNTKDAKLLIDENKIPDLTLINNSGNEDNNIINFNLDRIDGCDLNFKSEKSTSFSENQLTIELDDNNDNRVKAQCALGKNDINTIKCVISDEIENVYILKDVIINSAPNIVIISGNGDLLNISCKNKEKKNKSFDLLFIIIIIVIIFVLLIVCSIYICYNKSGKENEKGKEKENENEKEKGKGKEKGKEKEKGKGKGKGKENGKEIEIESDIGNFNSEDRNIENND